MSFLERRRQEDGFTLLELLIATMLAGILLLGITSGFIVALRSTRGVQDRFLESQDAQLISTAFTADVQSADPFRLAVGDPPSGTTTGCSSASSPASGLGSNILRLQWTETASSGTTNFSAAYRTTFLPSPPAPARTPDGTLTRYFCSGADLANATASPRVVAHDLSASSAPSAVQLADVVKLTLVSGSGYSYSLAANFRTPSGFIVTYSGSPVAGIAFNVNLLAVKADGSTDTSYSGTKILRFIGPDTSPGGNDPIYPASVSFGSGAGTASVKLFKSGTSSLFVTEGTRQGSASVTIAAADVPLNFSPCPPATTTNTSTAMKVVRAEDPFGNPDPNIGVATSITLSAGGAGAFSPASPWPLAANSTDSSAASPSSYTTPIPPGSVILTASASTAGYSPANCSFTTTGAGGPPSFVVSPIPGQVAGTAFNVIITASNGVTRDMTYTGNHTITFTGPTNAPNGNVPAYPLGPPAGTVNFNSGVGTASITLFRAEVVTLSVAEGVTRTGTASVTVSAATVPLMFSVCPPNVPSKATTVETVIRPATDTYGNPTSTFATDVTLSSGSKGSFSRAQVTIPAGGTTSGPSTYTNPSGNNQNVPLTGQSASSGYVDASCPFTTT